MRVQLTDRFVATARADGAQAEFFDTKVKGLSLRVSRAGTRRWHFHYTVSGRQAGARIAWEPIQPRRWRQPGQPLSRLDRRWKPAATRVGNPKASTVAALVDSYLAKRVVPNLRGADAIKRRLFGPLCR